MPLDRGSQRRRGAAADLFPGPRAGVGLRQPCKSSSTNWNCAIRASGAPAGWRWRCGTVSGWTVSGARGCRPAARAPDGSISSRCRSVITCVTWYEHSSWSDRVISEPLPATEFFSSSRRAALCSALRSDQKRPWRANASSATAKASAGCPTSIAIPDPWIMDRGSRRPWPVRAASGLRSSFRRWSVAKNGSRRNEHAAARRSFPIHDLQRQSLSRDALLIKLGAAKKEATRRRACGLCLQRGKAAGFSKQRRSRNSSIRVAFRLVPASP